MSQEDVEIVRRAVEVFARDGTRGSFQGLVAEDVELHPAFEVTGGTSFVGGEGFARFMRHWTEDFDDWKLEVDELRDAGEAAVVARMRQSARGRVSGTPVELRYAMVFRLRGRQIVGMEVYMTDAEALKAVGLE